MKDRGDRDDIVITSKVSSPVARGVNDHNTSRWHIMREVERSLKRLQTDRIDVYLIHHFDETVGYEERTRALEDLVRDGKIRYTGVCNYQAWQIVQTLRVQDRINAGSLITVQNPYSMHKPGTRDEMFPMVRTTGLGIMAYSPLAVGLLSGDYDPDRMPSNMSLWGNRRSHAFNRVVRGAAADVIRANADVANRIGATPAQVAQAWGTISSRSHHLDLWCRHAPTRCGIILARWKSTCRQKIWQHLTKHLIASASSSTAKDSRTIDKRHSIRGLRQTF